MNTAKTEAADLVFRTAEANESSQFIPVSTSRCKLAKNDQAGNLVSCNIHRDQHGAELHSLTGDVRVNGKTVDAVRLSQNDQIQLGEASYFVDQLGFLLPTEQGSAVSENVDSRIEQIQTELDRHNEGFAVINQKFDDMSQKISTLIDSINQTQTQPEPTPAQPEAFDFQTDAPATATTTSTDPQIADSTNAEPVESVESFEANAQLEKVFATRIESAEEDTDTLAETPASESTDNALTSDAPVNTDFATAPSDEESTVEITNNFESTNPEAGAAAPTIPTNTTSNDGELATSSTSENDMDSSIEQLLCSLRNEPSTEAQATATTDLDEGESFTDSQANGQQRQEINEASSPDSDESESAIQFDSSRLENLFSSLKAKEQQDPQPNAADGDETTESSLGDFPSSRSEDDLPMETVNQLHTDQPESSVETETAFELDKPGDFVASDNTQTESELVAESTEQTQESDLPPSRPNNERALLDQLRSLQREQAEAVEAEIKAENAQLQTEEETNEPESTFNDVDSTPLNESASTVTDDRSALQQAPTGQSGGQESVADVLARMNLSTSFEDDSTSEPANVSKSETTTTFDDTTSSNASSSQFDEPAVEEKEPGGCDVQDYMNSLLQRLQGGPSAEPIAPKVPEKKVEEPVAAAEPEETVTENITPLSPEEYIPQQVAPEKTSNMAAMRELANAMSRNAVNTSLQKRKQDAANTGLYCGIGSIVAAVATMLMSQATGDGFYWLSLLFFGSTILCSGYYGKCLLQERKEQAEKNQDSDSKE